MGANVAMDDYLRTYKQYQLVWKPSLKFKPEWVCLRSIMYNQYKINDQAGELSSFCQNPEIQDCHFWFFLTVCKVTTIDNKHWGLLFLLGFAIVVTNLVIIGLGSYSLLFAIGCCFSFGFGF